MTGYRKDVFIVIEAVKGAIFRSPADTQAVKVLGKRLIELSEKEDAERLALEQKGRS